MKYNWNEMSNEQKIVACKNEATLETHNGTTKEDLINIVKFMEERIELLERENELAKAHKWATEFDVEWIESSYTNGMEWANSGDTKRLLVLYRGRMVEVE